MPELALGLCLLWFVLLFVVRSVLQWRRTGSTGVKGFHGRVLSLEWIAGAAASLGLLLTPLAPLAALRGWPGGALLFSNPALHLAGAAVAVVGIVGALVAQLAMGDSWRVGVDESERTALVTGGPFRWVRNPIFSFMIVSVLAFLLVVPNLVGLLAVACTFVGIELQVRVVEEPYLRSLHGDAYAAYESRVGRFVPGLGRRRTDSADRVAAEHG